MPSPTPLSTQEQIEAIYTILEKQERRYKRQLIGKWALRSIVVCIVAYLFLHPEVIKTTQNYIFDTFVLPQVREISDSIIESQKAKIEAQQQNLIQRMRGKITP